jgi:hypothetical protein
MRHNRKVSSSKENRAARERRAQERRREHRRLERRFSVATPSTSDRRRDQRRQGD